MSSKTDSHKDISADEHVDRLLATTLAALEDMKAVDVRVIDVRGQTSITDIMVVASGTSTRHVKAIADNVELEAKQTGVQALGVEGEKGSEWILIDLADVVVHVMMPAVREFYALEKLWSVGGQAGAATEQDS
ncbi:MAG: ribosome silencing factor [Gammaproteobacteria bacterium]|nr:ribosome silencing factor [Gammaproteobacteria bacterium]